MPRKNPDTLAWLLLIGGAGAIAAFYLLSRKGPSRAPVAESPQPRPANGGRATLLRPRATLLELYPDVWAACQAQLGAKAHHDLLEECVVGKSVEAAQTAAAWKAARHAGVGNYEVY